jgi:hypothetical protein
MGIVDHYNRTSYEVYIILGLLFAGALTLGFHKGFDSFSMYLLGWMLIPTICRLIGWRRAAKAPR